MLQSKEKTDQRLVDMIRMKYAQQDGVKLGLANFNFSDDEKLKFETSSQSGGKSRSDLGNFDAENPPNKFTLIASVRK